MIYKDISPIKDWEEYQNFTPTLNDPKELEKIFDVLGMDCPSDKHRYFINYTTNEQDEEAYKVVRKPYKTCLVSFMNAIKGYFIRILSERLLAVEFYDLNLRKDDETLESVKPQFSYAIFMTKDGNGYTDNKDFNPDRIGVEYDLQRTDISMAIREKKESVYLRLCSASQAVMREFFGTALSTTGNSITRYENTSDSNLYQLFKTSIPATKTPKAAQQLLKLPLPDGWDTKEARKRIVPLLFKETYRNKCEVSVSVIQKVNERVSIMRIFRVSPDVSVMTDKELDKLAYDHKVNPDKLIFDEYVRVYVEAGAITSFKRILGGWYKVGNSILKDLQTVCVQWDAEEMKGTRFAYVKLIQEENGRTHDSLAKVRLTSNTQDFVMLRDHYRQLCNLNCLTLTALTMPVVEQLIKSKYSNLARLFMLMCSNTGYDKTLGYMFGVGFKKGVQLSDITIPDAALSYFDAALEGEDFTGVAIKHDTKKEGKTFEVYHAMHIFWNSTERHWEYFKSISPRQAEQIAGLLMDTVKHFKDYVADYRNDAIACINLSIGNLYEMFGLQNPEKYFAAIQSLVESAQHILKRGIWAASEYYDYLHMLYFLSKDAEAPAVDGAWKFKDLYDFCESLNEVRSVYTMFKNEDTVRYYQRMFDEKQDDWKKYSYDSEDFVVTAPVSPADLIMEGTTLHHCVKSYIHSVAEGHTTILFIRKASAPDTPFYTLEVKKNRVRQCHGFGNCNMTDDVKGFLRKYCRNKKIAYNDGERMLADAG